ncbi:GNAT family N-acetyltransferase [Halopelagius longus]|uniref:N-acetyltransferase n=1 Tax=Halopelagius longus TaxID=1236180 RepID=A0A1H0YQ07_9EURY|nr:GNAT family N-acetyltransferase [Halopelagius longus]RDI72618.1 N-acetyltransferase [Halopelagius longus]SDQ17317.1 Ribosomal protein S18 acetylase RimI [Halopelagius longus]
MSETPAVTIRPYESDDAAGLWDRKREFELGIGSETGDEGTLTMYEEKLTADYRARWLHWVERCVEEDPDSVTVAVVEGDAGDGDDTGDADAEVDADAGDNDEYEVVGYSFVLPESLSFVWDAAVLNEIFVLPEYRGTGVADDLMEAALDCAKDQDLPLDRMVLDVDRQNERAQSFYERYGFEHWGEMIAREL